MFSLRFPHHAAFGPRTALPLLIAATAGMAERAMAADVAARLANRVAAHREASTITPGFATWHLPGAARDDSARYSVEAVIAPAFALWHDATGPYGMQLDAAPRFAVRRAHGVPSNPVLTPDYRPYVRLYAFPTSPSAEGWGASVTLEHHSNGQSGPLLNPDGGGPNLENGSFSLWSVAAALHLDANATGIPRALAALLPASNTVLVRRTYRKEGALDALYPDWILSMTARTSRRAHAPLGALAGDARLEFGADWMPRTRDDLPDAWKPAPFSGMVMAVYAPRIHSGTAEASAPLLGDAELFLRLQAGHDPYNVRFARPLRRMDAGLTVALGR